MKYQLQYTQAETCTHIELPASKSISNRVLLLKALSDTPCKVINLSKCDDTQIMKKALESKGQTVDIEGAGTAMRFMTAYYSIVPQEHILTGNSRMQQRPIKDLVDALQMLGADISYIGAYGYPPILIKGKQLCGGKSVTINVDKSSQFASALIMLACKMRGGLQIELSQDTIVSRPYLDMTIHLMKAFGIDIEWNNRYINIPEKLPTITSYTVENDWSAASYWYEMVAIIRHTHRHNMKLFIPHLRKNSIQGDARIADIFYKLGLSTQYEDNGIYITGRAIDTNFLNEDVNDIPDLVPTLVVSCCILDIPFKLKGVQSLRFKECDRTTALITEMNKLGYILKCITVNNIEILSWEGERREIKESENVIIETYNDHRMAMAFSGACIKYPNIQIDNPDVVSKSYPSYWVEFKKIGITVIHST